jgi:superfamily II DNA or RNA helicase
MANNNPFQIRRPFVVDNPKVRTPQQETFIELAKFASDERGDREAGVVLPVGCGKSGCITLAPFAFASKRTLVVAPGLNIAKQLADDFDPTRPEMFYQKCGVLDGPPFPEPVEIRGTTANMGDLEEAHVVVTNIGQLQGEGNRWLDRLPPDFFDLIVFDEGHHNVAASWETLKKKFPSARIVNFSATPLRADGQLMAGRIIYSYPVFRAIQEGYVKRLRAVVLNPKSLRYVRKEDGEEITVNLDEVRKLGEDDSDFRRSIVTSEETLNTIVDASIRQLEKLRKNAGDDRRLKIIASALNYAHCHQIVAAYKAKGLRADFVHSKEGKANDKVFAKLEAHDLDVIVQVRKLGEGFDHKYLAVAAVFSVFSNLSPFIQFVGRIMRVVEQNAPGAAVNNGAVVFHAGANVARRWSDFQTYSEADREYFDQLLPLEEIALDEQEIEPNERGRGVRRTVAVRGQEGIELEVIPLIEDDVEAQQALKYLRERGYTADQVKEEFEKLSPVPTTKVRERQAKRGALDAQVRTAAGATLLRRGISPGGHELDKQHLGRDNFIVMKAAIDRHVNALVGHKKGDRTEFTRPELDLIEGKFDALVEAADREIFGGD